MNSEGKKSLHEDDEDVEDGSINKIDMYMKLLNKSHLQHIWDHVLKGFCAEDISNFKRFMVLKSVVYDFNASILSPTARIDAVWHHLLLCPKEYLTLCTSLNPPILDKYEMVQHCIIDHNPNGGSEVQQERRLENTYQLFQLYYQINLEYDERKADSEKKQILLEEQQVRDKTLYTLLKGKDGALMTLFARLLWTGKVIKILVDTNDFIYLVKCKIQDLEGIPTDSIKVVFAGHNLEDHRTLSDCNIQKHDYIDIFPLLRGC